MASPFSASPDGPVVLIARTDDLIRTTRRRCDPLLPLTVRDASAPRLSTLVDSCRKSQAVLVEWGGSGERLLDRLAKSLRGTNASDPGPPLIAVCENERDRSAALLAGADFSMTAPVRPEQVQAVVVAFHRRWRAETSAAPASAGDEPGPVAAPQAPRSTGDGRPAREPHGDGRASQAPVLEETGLRAGPLTLDPRFKEIYVNDTRLSLSPRPLALLAYLMRHADECCEREQLLDEVWDLDFDPSTNLVSVQICEIRDALEPHGYRDLVQTVRGRGYRLRTPDE